MFTFEGDNTFRYDGQSFFSCNREMRLSPAFVILNSALTRATPGTELNLPEGYDREKVERLYSGTNLSNIIIVYHPDEASALQTIGEQVLALDRIGAIQPPLNWTEKDSIQSLIDLVGRILPQPEAALA